MCECKKLLVVAEELKSMTDVIKAKQTDDSIQEIMLNQQLYGIQLSIQAVLIQINQGISIEKVNGDS